MLATCTRITLPLSFAGSIFARSLVDAGDDGKDRPGGGAVEDGDRNPFGPVLSRRHGQESRGHAAGCGLQRAHLEGRLGARTMGRKERCGDEG